MTALERVRRMAADIFRVDLGQVTPESSPEQVETWDSLHHLQLVLALEEAFGLSFEPEEVERMKTIAETAGLVEAKLGENR